MNYENRIVAFVDILGFQSKVNASTANHIEFQKIHAALNRIYQMKTENEGNDFQNMRDPFGVEVSTFSDSAVISVPAVNDELFFIIMRLIHLQLELASVDVLLRGGLTIGSLYHDGNIVFGPAMNRAYYLESKEAIYPRIIIDMPAIEQFRAYIKGDDFNLNLFNSLIRRDDDLWYYIDMFSQEQELDDSGSMYLPWLQNLRTVIINGLAIPDPKINAKYQWLKNRLNALVVNDDAWMPVPEGLSWNEQGKWRDAYKALFIP